MGTVGNAMNVIDIIIAENEEKSPWEPLSVRRGKVGGFGGQPAGYKKGENVITLCMGCGVFFPQQTGKPTPGELI